MINQIENNQNIAYKSISNILKYDRLSHCILFEGYKSNFKLDLAFMLSYAIVTKSKDLKIRDINLYDRILKNEYLDIFFIDGSKEIIKKEDILMMFERFKNTGFELNNKKVYIINNINNASSKVLNMLLKYSEEPTSKDIYGIFITDDVNNLLETIKSRSLRILFKKDNEQLLLEKYRELNISEGLVLTRLNIPYSEEFNFELFKTTYAFFKEFIYNLANIDKVVAYYHFNYLENIKKYEKDDVIKNILIFLDLILLIFNDNSYLNDEFSQLKNKIINIDKLKFLSIIIHTKNKINSYYDYKLLLDEMFYNLKGEVLCKE